MVQEGAEIKPLTSLRGIAALLVVVFHLKKEFGSAIDLDTGTAFFAKSYLWVDFFFILSGFVISYVYGRQFAHGVNLRDYRYFLIKRLGRIYPLHFFTLMCFIPTEAMKYFIHTNAYPPFSVNTYDSILANLLLIHAWGIYDHTTWNHPSWSISTEWFAYLVFPALVLLLWRVRQLAGILILGACFLAALYGVVILGGLGNLGMITGLAVFRCLFSFALGILVYRLYINASPRFRQILGSDVSFGASLLAALWSMHLAAQDVITVAIFCWVVGAASLNAQVVGRALSCRPLHYLGVISYSIYLMQGLVVRFWQAMFQIVWHGSIGTGQAIAILFALMLAVVAASSLSYRFIEMPGRNLFSQMAARLALSPLPQTASGA